MILPIVQYNEPILRRAGEPVREFDAQLKTLFHDMVATMHDADGIGLAAQQIGLDLRFCVIDLRGGLEDSRYTFDERPGPPLDLLMPLAMANPELSFPRAERATHEEGCLSFPDIRGDVERPEHVRVRYQDLEGHFHTIECDGLFARCIQHEADHLDGILFIDRMPPKTLKALEKKLKILKRRTRDSVGAK